MRRFPLAILGLFLLFLFAGCLTKDYNLRTIIDDRNYIHADSTSNRHQWLTKSWTDEHSVIWSSAGIIITNAHNVLGSGNATDWIDTILDDPTNKFTGKILVDFDFEKIPKAWNDYAIGTFEKSVVIEITKDEDYTLSNLVLSLEDYYFLNPEHFNVAGYGDELIGLIEDRLYEVSAEINSPRQVEFGLYHEYNDATYNSVYDIKGIELSVDPFSVGYNLFNYTATDMLQFNTFNDGIVDLVDATDMYYIVGGDRISSQLPEVVDAMVSDAKIDGYVFPDVTAANYEDMVTYSNQLREYYTEPLYPTQSFLVVAGIKDNIYGASHSPYQYSEMVKAIIDAGMYFTPGSKGGEDYFRYPSRSVPDWWIRVDNDSEWQDNPNNPTYDSYTFHPTKLVGNIPTSIVVEASTDSIPPTITFASNAYDTLGTGGDYSINLTLEANESSRLQMKLATTLDGLTGADWNTLSSYGTLYDGDYDTGFDPFYGVFYMEARAVDVEGNISDTIIDSLEVYPNLTDTPSYGGDFEVVGYWTPDVDVSGTMYFFDPTADAGGDGSLRNPWRDLETDVSSYIGAASPGDMAILLPGDHGDVDFSNSDNLNYIGIIGGYKQNAEISSLHFTNTNRVYVENVKFEKYRDEFPDPGFATADADTYNVYDTSPGLLEAASSTKIVVNNCTFQAQDTPFLTETGWNTRAPDAVRIIDFSSPSEEIYITNSLFRNVNYGIKTSFADNVSSVNNTMYNIAGDFHQNGMANNWTVHGNYMRDQYNTNNNHWGAAQFWTNTATSYTNLRYTNNTLYYTTDLYREHLGRGHDSDPDMGAVFGLPYVVGWRFSDGSTLSNINVSNNVVAMGTWGGFEGRNVMSGSVVNNTFVGHLSRDGGINEHPDPEVTDEGTPFITFSYDEGVAPTGSVVVANNVCANVRIREFNETTGEWVNGYTHPNITNDSNWNPTDTFDDWADGGFVYWEQGVTDVTTYDLRPTENSVLVNAGNPLYGPSTDVNGNDRTPYAPIDIGAYEYQGGEFSNPEILTSSASITYGEVNGDEIDVLISATASEAVKYTVTTEYVSSFEQYEDPATEYYLWKTAAEGTESYVTKDYSSELSRYTVRVGPRVYHTDTLRVFIQGENVGGTTTAIDTILNTALVYPYGTVPDQGSPSEYNTAGHHSGSITPYDWGSWTIEKWSRPDLLVVTNQFLYEGPHTESTGQDLHFVKRIRDYPGNNNKMVIGFSGIALANNVETPTKKRWFKAIESLYDLGDTNVFVHTWEGDVATRNSFDPNYKLLNITSPTARAKLIEVIVDEFNHSENRLPMVGIMFDVLEHMTGEPLSGNIDDDNDGVSEGTLNSGYFGYIADMDLDGVAFVHEDGGVTDGGNATNEQTLYRDANIAFIQELRAAMTAAGNTHFPIGGNSVAARYDSLLAAELDFLFMEGIGLPYDIGTGYEEYGVTCYDPNVDYYIYHNLLSDTYTREFCSDLFYYGYLADNVFPYPSNYNSSGLAMSDNLRQDLGPWIVIEQDGRGGALESVLHPVHTEMLGLFMDNTYPAWLDYDYYWRRMIRHPSEDGFASISDLGTATTDIQRSEYNANYDKWHREFTNGEATILIKNRTEFDDKHWYYEGETLVTSDRDTSLVDQFEYRVIVGGEVRRQSAGWSKILP